MTKTQIFIRLCDSIAALREKLVTLILLFFDFRPRTLVTGVSYFLLTPVSCNDEKVKL